MKKINTNKTISFVIPVYNEEARIKKTFDALKSVKLPSGLKLSEVIFVNDGSTDKTKSIISNFKSKMKKKLNVTLVSYEQNQGKGYAIKQGMLKSNSDYTLFFDADMSTPLVEIKKMMPFMEKNIDVIIGTRKNGHSTVIRHQPLYRELMGKVFTRLTQFALNTKVTDFTCGFKVFSKKATLEIFSKSIIAGWGYDAEIVFLAEKLNFSVQEVAVTWTNDERTKVKLYAAILKTLMELGQIRYIHTLEPMLKNLASVFFTAKIKLGASQ